MRFLYDTFVLMSVLYIKSFCRSEPSTRRMLQGGSGGAISALARDTMIEVQLTRCRIDSCTAETVLQHSSLR